MASSSGGVFLGASSSAGAAAASGSRATRGGGGGAEQLPRELKDMTIRDDDRAISYSAERVVGNGSFGVVFQALNRRGCGSAVFEDGRNGGDIESVLQDKRYKNRDLQTDHAFSRLKSIPPSIAHASLRPLPFSQASCLETGETVAIKKVLQDKRYKNRELQIMRLLEHPNVVALRHCFFSTTDKDELYLNLVLEFVPETVYRITKHYTKMNQRMPLLYVKLYTYQVRPPPGVGVALRHCFFSTTDKDELYLNLVLEFVPETVYRITKHYTKMNQRMPLLYVKLYTYQICRALAYIHNGIGVCHRDIKPQNLLVNPHTHQLKLCDFGSAKVLVKGEPNISYICSRYYRAPELIFGATEYTTAIDIWSAGCVMAELLLGQPLFPGESGVDQLVEIIKVLGTPTREEIKCMNPNYTEFKFPQIKAHPWHKVFSKRVPAEAVDLVSRLLQYSPNLRCTAAEALVHPFFDEIKDPNTRLPNGKPLPPLFNFKKEEFKGVPIDLVRRIVPEHTRRQNGHLLV
ncbi:unnamed protein product [Closterium sp. NIES-65]|nr:unnamed protein product [Closterium sp. NIES-65]